MAYGIFCNAAGGHILEKQFYRQVTDSAWEKEISDLLANEQGLFRLEQGGSFEEKKANINRIWDMRQWSSSIYSSVEADSYNKFREDVFGVEQPYRNHLMQGTSENPLFQKFMGVKYFLEQKAGQKAYDVHIQEQAAPVLYATDQLISQKAYESLSFPYNQTALMQFAVANDGTDFTEQEIGRAHV